VTAESVQDTVEDIEDITADIPLASLGRSQGRTLSEGECGVLTSLTWTIGDIHSNKEFAKNTEFGDIILGGPVVLAVASGLFATADFYRVFKKKYRVRMIAALGVEAKYLKPFLPGDTIWVETAIESARMSKSRPGAAVVLFTDDVINQRGDTIMKMKRPLLMVRDKS
jgi:acyl dehydratase